MSVRADRGPLRICVVEPQHGVTDTVIDEQNAAADRELPSPWKVVFRRVSPAQFGTDARVFPPDFADGAHRLVTSTRRHNGRIGGRLDVAVEPVVVAFPRAVIVNDVYRGANNAINRGVVISAPAFKVFT